MSNCPKAAFIGISPAKAKFSFILKNLTKVPEMVSTIFYFAKKLLSSHSTSFPFLQYSLLFFSETVKRDNHTYYLIHSDSPYTPMSFLIFIVLSFSIYCSIHNCNLIGKILFFYVIHLYPISILYGFTFTALSDTSYFFHCSGIFVFIIM